jgi:hypothetical protein
MRLDRSFSIAESFMNGVVLCIVDDSSELHAAVRFATRLAQRQGAEVGLLAVLEPLGLNYWMGVASDAASQQRATAEAALHYWSNAVHALTNKRPLHYIREGEKRQEILEFIRIPNSPVRQLVLAAASNSGNPGPLVSSLVGKDSGQLPIPVTVVPGQLTDIAIDRLTGFVSEEEPEPTWALFRGEGI